MLARYMIPDVSRGKAWSSALSKALIVFVVMVLSAVAWAHAFVDHAEPRVGSKVDKPPTQVKIWFTEKIEADFSSIKVFGPDGKQVDKKDSHLDPKDGAVLIVSLPAIGAGKYKVEWKVVSTDTHKTSDHFQFTVKGQK